MSGVESQPGQGGETTFRQAKQEEHLEGASELLLIFNPLLSFTAKIERVLDPAPWSLFPSNGHHGNLRINWGGKTSGE